MESAVSVVPADGLADIPMIIETEQLDLLFATAPGGQEGTLERKPSERKKEELQAEPIAKAIIAEGFFRNGSLVCVTVKERSVRFAEPIRLTRKNMLGIDRKTEKVDKERRKASLCQPPEQCDVVRRLLVSHIDQDGHRRPGRKVKQAIVDLLDGKVVVFDTPLPRTNKVEGVQVTLFIPAHLDYNRAEKAIAAATVRHETADERDERLRLFEEMRNN